MNEETKDFLILFLNNFLTDDMQEILELPSNCKKIYSANKKNFSRITFDSSVRADIEFLTKIICKKYCKKLNSISSQGFVISEDYAKDFLILTEKYFKTEKFNNAEKVLNVIKVAVDTAFMESLEYQNDIQQILDAFNSTLSVDIKSKQSINLTSLDENVSDFKVEIEESKRKANETGIAILGIFSALVLAFNGAILFSSATLESMNTTSIYRLLISIVTLGIVFINIAYALFHFISALIERNSLIKRQNTPESENKDAKSKKKGSKLFDRTHLIIINFVTLLIIIAIVCCWNFGVVEKRNQRLEQELTSMVEISDTNTTTIDDLTEMNNVEY